ncbi:6519_t:CDS:2 [Funneliformis geosporum]|uniref:17762_t:CDS:1 n=1 Tax=Funneliformis geosporum TaxID=1117311 RepID=A0A9W4SH27_9GLOM|nr:6519_t:CDS:2 [Funneliformis geosporum]CAI2168231.1 17762_t:CDS:2 [Funneliformis geosporum]
MSQPKNLFFSALLLFVVLLVSKVYSFDPNTVDPNTKATWCNDQTTTCTNICNDNGSGGVSINYCKADTLEYSCVCANGITPNSTEYTQTIPYFMCIADQETCTKNCGPAAQDCVNGCQKNCTATYVRPPKEPPTTVGDNGKTPDNSAASPTSTPKNPNTLLNSAAFMISPIQGSFLLLFTLVITFLGRVNSA